jgi:hypothetical protein
MARKTKAPRPARADRAAAEHADYRMWLADAVAELQRRHNINPAIIPQRTWQHMYIRGRTPSDAADQAAVSAHNVRRPPIG